MKDGIKTILIQLVGWVVIFVIIAFAMKGCQSTTLFGSHDSEREAYYSQMTQEERHLAEDNLRMEIDELEHRQDKLEGALEDLYFELGESDEKFESSAVAETINEEYSKLEKDKKALEQELEELNKAKK